MTWYFYKKYRNVQNFFVLLLALLCCIVEYVA